MSKAVFPEKPAVRPLEGSDYELAQDFYFPAKVGEWEVVVHVKPGFRTDGASIPRLLWRVFGSPYDPDIFADAIGHDAMYRGEIVPRKDADAAFLRMMEASGVRKRKRRLVWIGVRLFGWITWLRHTPESVAEARKYISLAFAGGEKQTTTTRKGKSTMKKLMMIALAACAAALAGCRTVSVENNGEGKGWKVSVMSNMMKSEADNINATVNPDGTITFGMGGLRSEPSEEFAKSLMTLTYIARLAAAIASPAAAGVPLNESAADPQAVAAILAAQASAKAATVKAKADAAVGKIEAKAKADAANAQQGCADGGCTDCSAGGK